MKTLKRRIATIAAPFLFKKYFKNRKVNWNSKKFAVTISFDLDYSTDCIALPELVQELDSRNIKASFACIGKWIEKYPKQHSVILDSRHEIINHTYSHPDNHELKNFKRFDEISYAEQEKEIEMFEKICTTLAKTDARRAFRYQCY